MDTRYRSSDEIARLITNDFLNDSVIVELNDELTKLYNTSMPESVMVEKGRMPKYIFSDEFYKEWIAVWIKIINRQDYILRYYGQRRIDHYLGLFETLITMEKYAGVEVVLDYLYSEIGDALVEQKFNQCDDFLRIVDVYNVSFDALVGILTITFTWRRSLNERDGFFNRVKDRILRENPSECNDILRGLE